MQAEPSGQPSSEPGASTAPKPADAAPSATVKYVRPPPGLAQGKYDVPAWLVGVAAGVTLLAVIAFLVVRSRRARNKAQYESVSPQSLPPSGPVSSRR